MFRVLLKKYFNESALLLSACAIMLVVFPWVRIWTVSQFDLSGFAPVLDQLRAFEKFSPVMLDQFLTHEGMIGLTFIEPILILCVLVWSISRGSDLVSGEIGRGTMEMLIAQPVSRIKVAAAHAVVSVSGLAVLCGATWLGVYLGLTTNSIKVRLPQASITIPFLNWELRNPVAQPATETVRLSDRVPPKLYLPATFNLFGLGTLLFGLSIFASSFDQYRWRTIGIVIGVYVLQALLYILAKSAPQFRTLLPLSFMSAYQPDWITHAAHQHPNDAWSVVCEWTPNVWIVGPMGYTLILISLGIAFYLCGIFQFQRRDIPAPL